MRRKILCTVPGCQHGCYRETAIKRWGTTRVRFICTHHWKRLTKKERRVFYRIERLEKKFGFELGERGLRVFDALVRRCQA